MCRNIVNMSITTRDGSFGLTDRLPAILYWAMANSVIRMEAGSRAGYVRLWIIAIATPVVSYVQTER